MPGIKDCNCILVIGATSGIGKALALAFHALETRPTVLIAGRRENRLQEIVKDNDDGTGRLVSITLDVTADNKSLENFVEGIVKRYPELDAVLFANGIQRDTDFTKPETIDLDAVALEITTNYTSVLALIKLFSPHFLARSSKGKSSFFIPVSSMLAIVPGKAEIANYNATKSALHAVCIALHKSLLDTNVHVMEIMPPLVESELHDHRGTTEELTQYWMPLEKFTKHAMEGLEKGEFQVFVPQTKDAWDAIEKGRIERCMKMGSNST